MIIIGIKPPEILEKHFVFRVLAWNALLVFISAMYAAVSGSHSSKNP